MIVKYALAYSEPKGIVLASNSVARGGITITKNAVNINVPHCSSNAVQ